MRGPLSQQGVAGNEQQYVNCLEIWSTFIGRKGALELSVRSRWVRQSGRRAIMVKFRLGDLVEATAAHIVPKRKSGTDDPRNGLALCRTHHWAFDTGIFTLSDGYEVLLSPAVQQAETHNFGLLDLGDKPVLLPGNEVLRPHRDAVAWHRENVWRG